jgi:hypothetical protein
MSVWPCFIIRIKLVVGEEEARERKKEMDEAGSKDSAEVRGENGVVLNLFFSAFVGAWHGANGHLCFKTASKTWRLASG